MFDWREGSSCMTGLIAKLRTRPNSEAFYDITFKLPDGGTVFGHRLILAIASPYFEAQFFGLLASDHSDTIVIKVGMVGSHHYIIKQSSRVTHGGKK